jgi:glycerophosphoryl diester phosphodiesterase
MTKPILIAHRGYSGKYPENTLMAYQAAYQHGARYMELDIQLTKDAVPVLHHDASLQRMSGQDFDIRDLNAKELKQFNASYPERFGDKFADNKFTKFKKFCRWLSANPDVTAFIEFKQESIDRFGIPRFVDEVYRRAIKNDVLDQCIFISFNAEVVEYTRKIAPIKTGWVLPEWDDKNHKTLEALKPEFLFCSTKKLPNDDAQIWHGSWIWALYNLDDIPSALAMLNRGMQYLETNEIGTLMQSEQLR